eukprot:m.44498 g.44498  ORF g.44498 m.44498 type:complete len:332 (-) comp7176_c0_seq1:1078-2073(-)
MPHELDVALDVFKDLFLGRLFATIYHPKDLPQTEHVEGKVFVVTGCTSGIGEETVKRLLLRGGTVVMGCRKTDVASSLVEKWAKEGTPFPIKDNATIIYVDLMSLSSVDDFCSKLLQRFPKIDVLINNAGLFDMVGKRTETGDGYEKHFQVNYLSPLIISIKLLDALSKSSDPRVVNVSSLVHQRTDADLDNWQVQTGYTPPTAYARSKLLQVVSTHEMQARLRQNEKYKTIQMYCLHPGTIPTDIARDLPDVIVWLYKNVATFFLATVSQGADTQLYVATDPSIPTQYPKGGDYFVHCTSSSYHPAANNVSLRLKLWEKTEEAIGYSLLQ